MKSLFWGVLSAKKTPANSPEQRQHNMELLAFVNSYLAHHTLDKQQFSPASSPDLHPYHSHQLPLSSPVSVLEQTKQMQKAGQKKKRKKKKRQVTYLGRPTCAHCFQPQPARSVPTRTRPVPARTRPSSPRPHRPSSAPIKKPTKNSPLRNHPPSLHRRSTSRRYRPSSPRRRPRRRPPSLRNRRDGLHRTGIGVSPAGIGTSLTFIIARLLHGRQLRISIPSLPSGLKKQRSQHHVAPPSCSFTSNRPFNNISVYFGLPSFHLLKAPNELTQALKGSCFVSLLLFFFSFCYVVCFG